MLRPDTTFRRYLTAVILVTALVPLFAFALAEHFSIREMNRSSARERRAAASLILRGLTEQVQTAEALVQLYADRLAGTPRPDPVTAGAFAADALRRFPAFLNVHADDAQGRCVAFASRETGAADQTGADHSGRWHIAAQTASPGLHRSDAFQGQGATDRWIVSLSQAVTDKTQVTGYACAALNLSQLAAGCLAGGAEGYLVTMTDRRGGVLYSDVPGRTVGSVFTPADGSGATVRDAGTGFSVTVESRFPSGDLPRLVMNGLVLFGLTLLLSLFAGARFARPLSDGVEALEQEIRDGQKGAVQGLPVELRHLREAWQRAVKKASEAASALEAVNRGLEETVSERTREIQSERKTLSALIGSLTDGLLLLDAEHRVRFHNAEAARLFPALERPADGAGRIPLASLLPALTDAELTAGLRAVRTKGSTGRQTFEVTSFPVSDGAATEGGGCWDCSCVT